uniref:Uncharacterized protein n=1 Tax=Cannabis sativa TaxID=3483 RepID=A0A803Q058_CANSA
MHRTASTQLFLNHAQVFADYRKEDLNVGDLVTRANCKRGKLILASQSVDDFNLSKVLCPNVRNPWSEKALREDIILSAEDGYNKYRYKREQELALSQAQATSRRVSWEEARKEKTLVRPKFPFPVPNFGSPNASTSRACKSPLNIHFVPSVQDYTDLRPVEFDNRLYSLNKSLNKTSHCICFRIVK